MEFTNALEIRGGVSRWVLVVTGFFVLIGVCTGVLPWLLVSREGGIKSRDKKKAELPV